MSIISRNSAFFSLVALVSALTLAMGDLAMASPPKAGKVIFEDRFDSVETIGGNWQVKGKAVVTNGAVNLRGDLSLYRETPRAFYAAADITLPMDAFDKSSRREDRFAGFNCAGFAFWIRTSGSTMMLWKLAGQKNTQGKYVPIPGFELGRPARLEVMREMRPGSAIYTFHVNGTFAGKIVCDGTGRPDISGKLDYGSLSISSGSSRGIEIDNFILRDLDGADSSPNLLINSGFELDEGGYPLYYCRGGGFDLTRMKDYGRFLDSWRVDRTEKHSGKQSLRLTIDDTSTHMTIWAWGAGSVKGVSGIFSLWMKSDVEGLPVTIAYGARKTVEVGTEWKRYEVLCRDLPAGGFWVPPVSVSVARKNRGTLWLDDLQAEIVEPEKAGKQALTEADPDIMGDDFEPAIGNLELDVTPEPHATPYRPADSDETRLAATTSPRLATRLSVPILPEGVVPTVALDRWRTSAVMTDAFWYKGEKARRRTEALLACDQANLYIGFRNFGEETALAKLPLEDRDSAAMLQRDGIQVFLEPANRKGTMRFVATANGAQTDFLDGKAGWDGHWMVSAAVNDKAGSVDYLMTIPFSDLASPDLSGTIPMNLCRNDTHGEKEYQGLAKTPIPTYSDRRAWPALSLPEMIIRRWRVGAIGATCVTDLVGRASCQVCVENDSGMVRHVTASLHDTESGSQVASSDFELAEGENYLSFSAAKIPPSIRLELHDKGALLSSQTLHAESVPPVSLLERLSFYMDEKEARFRATCNLPGPEKFSLVFRCAGFERTMKGAPRAEFTMPLAEVADGVHPATLELRDEEGRLLSSVSRNLVKRPFWEGATQVNRFARCLQRGGRKIFFCGMALCNFNSLDESLRYVDFLKEHGFRHAHVLFGTADNQVKNGAAFLKKAEKEGLGIVLWTKYDEFGAEERQEEVRALFATTNILAQMVIDEPDLSMPSDECSAWLTKMRKLFPYHPVFMNNGTLNIDRHYADDNTDIFMMDSYLTNTENKPVRSPVSCVDTMRKAGASEGKPSFFFLVSHNFPNHYKAPSYGEQIAQSYGSIIAGCAGISYYINIPVTRGSFEAMTQVNREVMAIEQALLSEEPCEPCRCDGDRVELRHLTKRHEGALYIVSCNLDKKAAGKVTFTLPEGFKVTGKVEVLFENRFLELEDGRFHDDFKGHERHVYQIGLVPEA